MMKICVWRWVALLAVCIATSGACQSEVGGGSAESPERETDPDNPDNPDPPAPFEASPPVMPRLTAAQYRNTLEDVFGQDLPVTTLEGDTNPHLFYSIGAATTTLSEHGVEQFADAASEVAAEVFSEPARRDALVGCAPESAEDSCAQSFLTRLGRRLYRRPLAQQELALWTTLAAQTAEGDVYIGLETATAGMLQSPHFLYRVELGEPDPADATRLRYTSWEMAQRLAFLVWNSAPDDTLLDVAAAGGLLDDETLTAQALRMLESPRARGAVQDFFTQYLDLGRLAQVERDPQRYPGYTDTLPFAMEMEVRLLVDDLVFRRDGDLRELFHAPRAFVNDTLAQHYEVEAPGASAVSFVPVDLPADGPRAGFLTLGAFLTMNAHPTDTSPTLRGKYIRERILCQSVPDPPQDVDLNIERDEQDPRTLRERLDQHRDDPACAGCHAFVDPPGFLFEGFDSVGRFRTEVNGVSLDTSGNLDGEVLADAKGLAQMLRDDPRVPACVVEQLYRHANARLDAPTDDAVLEALEVDFARSGYRFKSLLVALVRSEGFRTVSPNEEVSP